MNVLALATPQTGITRVWALPDDPGLVAPAAQVPGADTATAEALVNGCKGSAKSWQDWAGELENDSPYNGTFSVEEVPDGFDPKRALDYLRSRTLLQLAGLDEAPPPLKLTTQGTGTKEPHDDPSVMYDEGGGKLGDNCDECYMSEWVKGVLHCSMVQDPIRPGDRCKRFIPKPVA